MPPKADPYATPTQTRVDLILLAITTLTIVFLFATH